MFQKPENDQANMENQSIVVTKMVCNKVLRVFSLVRKAFSSKLSSSVGHFSSLCPTPVSATIPPNACVPPSQERSTNGPSCWLEHRDPPPSGSPTVSTPSSLPVDADPLLRLRRFAGSQRS